MKKKLIWILLLHFAGIQLQAQQNIYVNQVGYLSNAPKYFYTDYPADSFVVINTESGKFKFNGRITKRSEKDPLAGFSIYTGEFSGLKEPGSYVIKVYSSLNSGIVSYPFKISNDVFSDLLLLANKSLFMQRCGLALEEKYVGKYSRDVCHLDKAQYHANNKVEGKKDMTGGWHDAGDYGKYIAAGSVTIANLLQAYELKPQALASDSWGIPESGNGIPDILDEVRWELDWMLKMQREDGAVHEKVHTKDYVQFIMPSEGKVPQFIYEVSSTATADFVAIMARSARIFKQMDKELAKKYLDAAIKSYSYLEKNLDIFPPGGFKNPPDTKAGGYSDAYDKDERLWAAVELFITTGKKSYHKDFLELNKNFNEKFYEGSWISPTAYAHYSYLLSNNENIDTDTKNKIKENLLSYAEKQIEIANQDGFRIAMKANDYVWGSNGHLLNKAINLLIAYHITNEVKYRNLALTHLDNVLGTNAMKMCYVTGIGTKRVIHLHHAPSVADYIAEPVPGIMTEGPNKFLQDGALKNIYTKDTPPAKTYIDDVESYSSNENTIHGNSSLIFVVAYLNSLSFKEDR